MNPIDLLNEAKIQKSLLDIDKKEIEDIEKELKTGNVSRKRRLEELFDLVKGHIKWLEDNAQNMSEAARLLRRVTV